MPANEDASEFELQNEANTGTMRGIDSGGIVDERSRLDDNTVNFRRGLFALMAAFDWNTGRFSDHPDDVKLKREGMNLVGIPEHLSAQFDMTAKENLLQFLKEYKEEGGRGVASTGRPPQDYVKGLIELSKRRRSTEY